MNKSVVGALCLFLSVGTGAQSISQAKSGVSTVEMQSIQQDMRAALEKEFTRWYPRAVDSIDGGFYSDLDYRWEVKGPQNKMIVTQSRHVWSVSNGYLHYRKDESFRSVADHGVQFLREDMWDREYGGFYDLVTREGEPIRENGQIVKRMYGNAFAIYALAASYEAFRDPRVLAFAQEAFRWLDSHSHDTTFGGYFQFMDRDGSPMVEGYEGVPPKDQNSSIHLLEALTQLYRVWPNKLVSDRLGELFRLVRDTITTDKGYMVLFFNRNWTPVSFRDSGDAVRERNYELDHVSFGHDIETAYLLLEASEALGMKNDPRTLSVAKTMVDHGLRYGWDKKHGGIFDGGYYFKGAAEPSIVRNTKEWWTQVETLNSCLLMAELFPAERNRYLGAFVAQWKYCTEYLMDHEHGGWYWGGIDIVPENKQSPKSTIWKCNYHTSRALINCLARLK